MRYSIIISIFTLLHISSSAQSKKPMRHFIPMNVGNYWVYSSDKERKLDTIKIVEKKQIGTDQAYVYSNGASWMERNDSVFSFQSQRTGFQFPCLEYFPYEGSLEYQIIIGGDALGRRRVEKLKNDYVVNNKPYSDCYKFEDLQHDNETVIISKGIGIIEIIGPTRRLTLVEYNVQ